LVGLGLLSKSWNPWDLFATTTVVAVAVCADAVAAAAATVVASVADLLLLLSSRMCRHMNWPMHDIVLSSKLG
jgi:hypothetical protein